MSNTKKVVLGVTSATLTAIAAALLLATGALAWLYGIHGTSDGFLNTPGVTLTAEGYAVVSTDFDIDALPDEWWVRMDTTGTLRVAARAAGDSPVFIGVAPASEVVDYLDDVAHVVVTRVSSNDRASYEERSGSRPPLSPVTQAFWAASVEGLGEQTLDWEFQAGEWALVVMNAAATPGVDVTASIGVDSPWIAVAAVVTAVLAVGTTLLAALTAVLAFRRPKPVTTPVGEPAEVSG